MWKSADLSGYYQERIELSLDAPTGFWQLELRADPADEVPATVFRFGVEKFLPERIKLSLTAPESGLRADGKLTLATTGTYLYGAPAAGNRLLGVVQFQRCMNPLSQSLPGFVFGDANEDSFHERRELTEAKLDKKDKTKLDILPVSEYSDIFSSVEKGIAYSTVADPRAFSLDRKSVV